MTTPALITDAPEAIWLSANPSFRKLEQNLVNSLACCRQIAHWGYRQTPDEPSTVEGILTLLHDYIKGFNHPVHLIGHSTGGLLGLLYARRYPQRVQSLTLLAVGVSPAVDWKAHYYNQLALLSCSRTRALTQMVQTLFGSQPRHLLPRWLELLERDLMTAFSLHSPLERFSMFPAGVPVPFLVYGGQRDTMVTPAQIQGWLPWLKTGDRMGLCPNGGHFFHTTHVSTVRDEVLAFWQSTDIKEVAPACLQSQVSGK